AASAGSGVPDPLAGGPDAARTVPRARGARPGPAAGLHDLRFGEPLPGREIRDRQARRQRLTPLAASFALRTAALWTAALSPPPRRPRPRRPRLALAPGVLYPGRLGAFELCRAAALLLVVPAPGRVRRGACSARRRRLPAVDGRGRRRRGWQRRDDGRSCGKLPGGRWSGARGHRWLAGGARHRRAPRGLRRVLGLRDGLR